ncbi:hypothetical protein V865_006340 [Kwoniella europaea PYCC6329]|uniref:Cysteine proteinase 1, mitochondrial n=1 Tax=Kwoniella europaea PYCC6329 TaxID=1423913 RepID=A0AAX4KQI7_9TREE
MGSQVSTARPTPIIKPVVITEKESSNPDVASPICSTTAAFDALSVSELDKWSRDFESNPTLALSRLVLSKADPVQSLSSRSALIHDAKIFNLRLKGTGPNGEYPGPRVNQASSGRCWLFATKKYGIIPKSLYPEAFSSTASGRLDSLLTSKLREYSLLLRAAAKKTNNLDDLRKLKTRYLSEIFSTLSIALGSPPKPDEKITWEYYDRDDKFHSWTGTPKEFYSQFGKRKGMDPKESFSIINDPRNEYGKLYSVERLGNVWKGNPVRYAVISGIRANTPLFFGCDVGKASNTPEGVMDCQVYDLKAAYGFILGMNKAQRLETGESSMTHAMVITAVHLDESGRPLRYKVENSWSESAGEKGWFMMTAEWFREYVFQVVVPKSIVDKKWSDVLKKGPVMLKPWDPMISFATG